MSSKFDYYVHGLWIIGALLFFFGALIAGNVEWIEGTTESSFAISVLLSFALFLTAGMCWISSSVNARHEESARVFEHVHKEDMTAGDSRKRER